MRHNIKIVLSNVMTMPNYALSYPTIARISAAEINFGNPKTITNSQGLTELVGRYIYES
jgi:hypothetical protein